MKNSKNDGNNSNVTDNEEIILNGLKFGLRGTEIANIIGVTCSTISHKKRIFIEKGLLTSEDLCFARKYRKKTVKLLEQGINKSEIASSLGIPLEIVEVIEENYNSDKVTENPKNIVKREELEKMGDVEKKEKWGNSFSKLSEKMQGESSIGAVLRNFLIYTKILCRTPNLDKKELEETLKIIAKAMGRTNSSGLRIQAYQVLLALTIKLRRPNQALMYCNKAINDEDIHKKEKAKFVDMSQQLIKAIKMKRIMRQQQYCPSDVIALLAREEGLPEIEVRKALRKYGNDMGKALEEIELEL